MAVTDAWYHHCAIKNKLADSFAVGGITPGMGFDQAVRRTDAEYRNFVEHGAGNIFCDTYGGRTNEWDLADAEAVLLKRNGAVLDPLLGNVSIPTGFADMGANPPRGVTDFSPTFHVREQNPSGCWGFAHRSSLHSRFRRVGSFA